MRVILTVVRIRATIRAYVYVYTNSNVEVNWTVFELIDVRRRKISTLQYPRSAPLSAPNCDGGKEKYGGGNNITVDPRKTVMAEKKDMAGKKHIQKIKNTAS